MISMEMSEFVFGERSDVRGIKEAIGRRKASLMELAKSTCCWLTDKLHSS